MRLLLLSVPLLLLGACATAGEMSEHRCRHAMGEHCQCPMHQGDAQTPTREHEHQTQPQ